MLTKKILLLIIVLIPVILMGIPVLLFTQTTNRENRGNNRFIQPNQLRNFISNKREVGFATWYGVERDSRPTSGGGFFNIIEFEATHPTYAIGSLIIVQNLETGKSTVVKIVHNERLVGKTIIDISFAAAKALGFKKNKYQRVEIQPFENDASEPLEDTEEEPNRFTYSNLARERERRANIPEEDIRIEDEEDYFDTYFLEDDTFVESDDIETPPPPPEREEPPELEIEEEEDFLKDRRQTPTRERPRPRTRNSRFPYGVPTGYTVQVGAFLNRSLAINYRLKLLGDFDNEVYIFIEGAFHKVLIGDFQNFQSAERFRRILTRRNIESLKPKRVN